MHSIRTAALIDVAVSGFWKRTQKGNILSFFWFCSLPTTHFQKQCPPLNQLEQEQQKWIKSPIRFFGGVRWRWGDVSTISCRDYGFLAWNQHARMTPVFLMYTERFPTSFHHDYMANLHICCEVESLIVWGLYFACKWNLATYVFHNAQEASLSLLTWSH